MQNRKAKRPTNRRTSHPDPTIPPPGSTVDYLALRKAQASMDEQLLREIKYMLHEIDSSDYIAALSEIMSSGLHRVGDMDSVERVTYPICRLMTFISKVSDITSFGRQELISGGLSRLDAYSRS